MRRIEDLAQGLADGQHHQPRADGGALARIADPAGEGAARSSRCMPTRPARWRTRSIGAPRGLAPGRYAGIPIALKDLFDIAGEPTPAGSKVLADAPPATANAPVVQRMLARGFIAMGRVNMTEFAFSGLGINPHYGTPSRPWDRALAAHSGRQFVRHRGGGGGRHGGGRAGHRHRRVLPHPGRVLRRRRLQAHRAAGADHRRAAAGAVAGFGRSAGAHRRLLRGDRRDPGGRDAGACRHRSA